MAHNKGNHPSNAKLVDRGTRMIEDSLGVGYEEAREMLLKAGSVKKAMERCR